MIIHARINFCGHMRNDLEEATAVTDTTTLPDSPEDGHSRDVVTIDLALILNRHGALVRAPAGVEKAARSADHGQHTPSVRQHGAAVRQARARVKDV